MAFREVAGHSTQERENVGGDCAEIVRMADQEVENRVDRRTAVRLRIDLPAGMVAVEKQRGAQVSEEGAAVGLVVAFAGR